MKEHFTVEIWENHCITTDDEFGDLVPICHHADLRFESGYHLPFVFAIRYGEGSDCQVVALCFECMYEASQLVRSIEGDLVADGR